MNYRQKIVTAAWLKTASFYEVVAAYEGEERRQNRRRSEPREEGDQISGRRENDVIDPVALRQEFERKMALPTVENMGADDLVIHIQPSFSKIYSKNLDLIADVGNGSIYDVWNKVEELQKGGKMKPNSKLWYTTKQDLRKAGLVDAMPVFKNYVLSRQRK